MPRGREGGKTEIGKQLFVIGRREEKRKRRGSMEIFTEEKEEIASEMIFPPQTSPCRFPIVHFGLVVGPALSNLGILSQTFKA